MAAKPRQISGRMSHTMTFLLHGPAVVRIANGQFTATNLDPLDPKPMVRRNQVDDESPVSHNSQADSAR